VTRDKKKAEAPKAIFARHSSLVTVFALSLRLGAFARGIVFSPIHQAICSGQA